MKIYKRTHQQPVLMILVTSKQVVAFSVILKDERAYIGSLDAKS